MVRTAGVGVARRCGGGVSAPNNNIKLESYNSQLATLRLLIFNPGEPLRLKVKIYGALGIIL